MGKEVRISQLEAEINQYNYWINLINRTNPLTDILLQLCEEYQEKKDNASKELKQLKAA